MKIVNLLLAVVFLLFAFVQINDPDPLIWIAIYGSMAVLCVLAAFRVFNKWLSIGLVIIFALYSVFLFPGVRQWMQQDDRTMIFDDVAKMQYPFVEESREFLGLVICMVVLAVHIIQTRRAQRHA